MINLEDRLRQIVGEKDVISGPDLLERATSYWDSSPTLAKAMVRPRSTEQVSDILRICNELHQTVVVRAELRRL